MKTETRNIENFDTINFRNFGNLILTQGDQIALTIEAEEDLLEEIISEVDNEKLTLGLKRDWVGQIGKFISGVFSGKNRQVTYHLTCVDIKKINISGQCNLTCQSLKVDRLKLNVSGLGDTQIESLDCNELSINISGRGKFIAAGRADQSILKISGSGDIDLGNLINKQTRITISGHGKTTVRAEEELNTTISGMSEINYYGRPKIRQTISGLGKTKRITEKA